MFRPKLPPKSGYIEVEINKERKYKNVTSGELLENEISPEDELKRLREDIDFLAESVKIKLKSKK